jgi:hypothetical protein
MSTAIAYSTDKTVEQNLIVPQSAYTGSTFMIISTMSYLTGVPKRIFENEGEPPKMEVYIKLDLNKNARIIRNLCALRTAIERKFGTIRKIMQTEHRSWSAITEYIPAASITGLSDDGISLKGGLKLDDVIIEINKLISDKINNCKEVFPSWLNWEYVRNLFIMPNGYTASGIKQAAEIYYNGFQFYPYQVYINWRPVDEGNIFYTDKKFVELLYRWNHDDFTDFSKVTDMSGRTKDLIYDFIECSNGLVFVVDCENSDPYKLFAAFRSLDGEYLDKISKIILFDDVNTIATWQALENFVKIPVEYELVERVKDNKSLVDSAVTHSICKEFYRDSADSFILASSDSDYSETIKRTSGAHFLVMIEHEKTSPKMKQRLQDLNTPYCYLDKFYTGDGDDIKIPMILSSAQNYINARVALNVNDMMEHVYQQTRIDMSDLEKKQFYNKFVKSLELKIDDETGEVVVRFKKRA